MNKDMKKTRQGNVINLQNLEEINTRMLCFSSTSLLCTRLKKIFTKEIISEDYVSRTESMGNGPWDQSTSLLNLAGLMFVRSIRVSSLFSRSCQIRS